MFSCQGPPVTAVLHFKKKLKFGPYSHLPTSSRAFSPNSTWLFYGYQPKDLLPNQCLALLWLPPAPGPFPLICCLALLCSTSSRAFIPIIAWLSLAIHMVCLGLLLPFTPMLKWDQHFLSLFSVKTLARFTNQWVFLDPHDPYRFS